MLDELFTNGIGGFGEFHVTRPGGDRLLWVEWTVGLIPIERWPSWVCQFGKISFLPCSKPRRKPPRRRKKR